MSAGERIPVSVVVPTIGRPEQLRRCLESVLRCDPPPAEVVVVDQSEGDETAALVAALAGEGVRHVRDRGRGIARALNAGLRSAQHNTVLVTHDDCTAADDWAQRAWRAVRDDPARLVTGRVRPAGDPSRTPSTRDDPERRDYTGRLVYNGLSGNNMVLNRDLVLAAGGFDESFPFAAEDSDFGYRWLRAGRRLVYEPDVVVWHHDWRSERELVELYVAYWRGAGQLYGKHLRHRDPRALLLLAGDLRRAVRGVALRLVRGTPRWSDPNRGSLRGLWIGLVEGWRRAAPRRAP